MEVNNCARKMLGRKLEVGAGKWNVETGTRMGRVGGRQVEVAKTHYLDLWVESWKCGLGVRKRKLDLEWLAPEVVEWRLETDRVGFEVEHFFQERAR